MEKRTHKKHEKGQIKMAHEFDGSKYEKASSHQKQWGEKLIQELGLNGSEKVLDLGCGDGSLTAQIANLLPEGEAVGIDASKGMIDVAQSKKSSNLSFLLMDINDLAFDEEFDVLFSNAALHWVKDHKLLLKNAVNALKQNGAIRFNFAADGNCSNFFRVIKETISLEKFAKYFIDFEWPWYMPGLEEYKSLVQESGLAQADVWGENADRYFPDEEAMIQWIDQPSLVPFLALVAGDDKKAFRDFVVEKMIAATKQDDGTCFETFRRINVQARK